MMNFLICNEMKEQKYYSIELNYIDDVRKKLYIFLTRK